MWANPLPCGAGRKPALHCDGCLPGPPRVGHATAQWASCKPRAQEGNGNAHLHPRVAPLEELRHDAALLFNRPERPGSSAPVPPSCAVSSRDARPLRPRPSALGLTAGPLYITLLFCCFRGRNSHSAPRSASSVPIQQREQQLQQAWRVRRFGSPQAWASALPRSPSPGLGPWSGPTVCVRPVLTRSGGISAGNQLPNRPCRPSPPAEPSKLASFKRGASLALREPSQTEEEKRAEPDVEALPTPTPQASRRSEHDGCWHPRSSPATVFPRCPLLFPHAGGGEPAGEGAGGCVQGTGREGCGGKSSLGSGDPRSAVHTISLGMQGVGLTFLAASRAVPRAAAARFTGFLVRC